MDTEKTRLERERWNSESENIYDLEDRLSDIKEEINRRAREQETREKRVDRGKSTKTENKGGYSGCLWLIIFILVWFVYSLFHQEKPRTLVSKDGDLKIKHLLSYQEACETGQARSSYKTKKGLEGELYPTKCNQELGNVEEYSFLDNRDDNRCQGIAKISTVEGKIFTYWRVDKKVPGYIYETVGETYNVEMN
ncbi:hypothetical protein [Okeania sp.]|uniref:hypothetical protein n=1 Tax=Okeania sp. TaxID=3100323 RepID=UPI002B4AF838|nr:hypothetical protein [Okeania sp.]MEB3342492.1 hypothetical protein [Okeania sp.]